MFVFVAPTACSLLIGIAQGDKHETPGKEVLKLP